jgi:acetyl-CoA carboxylase carboxyltransferase component
MGPNGEAHHVVASLQDAYRLLFDHLSLCEPSAHGTPAWSPSTDERTRSVADAPYEGVGSFTCVGDVLGRQGNPNRKSAFAIRPVMAALSDHDAVTLERWAHHHGAEAAVVWDTRIGGWPVTLLGVESQPLPDALDPLHRHRAAGTLYPEASRKLARALNAASGRRGAVLLANLAGFDGSAESLRGRQLEFGAEIARAVVNFVGPIVVVVIGRFHGGAYVVFNKRLNPSLTMLALDGTFVSVIGGEAAAGVVLTREVERGVEAELEAEVAAGIVEDRELRRGELVVAHRSRVAQRFDDVHSVHRAARVGSVDAILHPDELRPSVIDLLGAYPWSATARPTAVAASGLAG